MDYIRSYIGTNLEDLDFENLTTYFQSPQVESDTVEYKSYHVRGQNNHRHKESAILKTICGMLNSEGGMIIWGAPVEGVDSETDRNIYSGDLSLIDRVIDKDSFISKLSQSIVPMPTGVKLRILRSGENCACVIEVQRSETRPHQYDGRYWVRLDGQTKLAPHHYVEALMKEVRYPHIECYLKFEDIKRQVWQLHDLKFVTGREYIWLGVRQFIFNWSGHLNEENVMFQVVPEKGTFVESIYEHNAAKYRYEGRIYRPPNVHPTLYYGEPLTENYYLIIDPNEIRSATSFNLTMMIGGKKSPQKWSTYKVDIQALESGDIQNGFSATEDNKLVIDTNTELGRTKEQILNSVLQRPTPPLI